jgi:hypothetical protein
MNSTKKKEKKTTCDDAEDDENNEENENNEEEVDTHGKELLERLIDCGIDIVDAEPSTLRDHRNNPKTFVKIAQSVACAIGPLIKRTGADNVALALQSCVTLKNIRGTSIEDCASRALGALAVLAKMLDERLRDKIGTFRVFEILVAYLQAARILKYVQDKMMMKNANNNTNNERENNKRMKNTTTMKKNGLSEEFRLLEEVAGAKAFGYHPAHTAREIALGAKRVVDEFVSANNKKEDTGGVVIELHKKRVITKEELEAMSASQMNITKEANEAIEAEFKKRREMIAKRAGVSVQSLSKSSINQNNGGGVKRTRTMEDDDFARFEKEAFALASGEPTEITVPNSLLDLRGADIARSGLKAGSGTRNKTKALLIAEGGFDAKTVTIGQVPDRGGRVDETGRFLPKFKGGGSKQNNNNNNNNNNKNDKDNADGGGETAAATDAAAGNKRQLRKKK